MFRQPRGRVCPRCDLRRSRLARTSPPDHGGAALGGTAPCGTPACHEDFGMNANLRNFALWVIIVLLLLALFTLFQNPGNRTSSTDISFSELLTEVDKGNVRDVVIQGPEIHGTFTEARGGRSFSTYAPNDPNLVQRLYDKHVSI